MTPFTPTTVSTVCKPFIGIRLTVNTPRTFDETEAKLREAIKADSFTPGDLFGVHPGPAIMSRNIDEFERIVNNRVGPFGFMMFDVLQHQQWLSLYDSKPSTPKIVSYIIGNPLIAKTMLVHDYSAGLHVPLRVHLVESLGWRGCSVTWDLPSSHIAIGAVKDAEQETALREAAKVLDGKLEDLIQFITGTEVKAKL